MAKKTMQVGDLTITPLKDMRVRLEMGGKTCETDYKDLWGAVFMLGDKKYQEAMIPVQKKEMMVFSRKHQIRVTKDVKAGETVNVWCEVNVPQTIVAAIAEENGAKVILQTPADVHTKPLDKSKMEVQ